MARKNKFGGITLLLAVLSMLLLMQTVEAKPLTADSASAKTWTGIYYFPSSRVNSGRALPPGTAVSVDYLDRTGDWAYISSNEYGKGWVRRSALYFEAAENHTETEADSGQAYSGMTTTTTRWGSLHTNSPYRATDIAIGPNTTVTLQFSSVDGNWAYVQTGSGDGWLPLSQLKIDSLEGLPLWR